jgi:hypothetical protein
MAADQGNARFLGLKARVGVNLAGNESLCSGVSKLMSSNKTPSTRRKLASWCRRILSTSYRDQHRRASGCAPNQASGGNVDEEILSASEQQLSELQKLNRRPADGLIAGA